LGGLTYRKRRLGPGLCNAGLLAIAVAFLLPALLVAGRADTIPRGAKILTPDAPLTVAEAAAIRDGRIVAVGSTAEVMARQPGPPTQLIDLESRTVLPGLIDAHVHEFTTPFVVFHSLAEIRDHIREHATRTPTCGWTAVAKTFPVRLCEMRMPTWEVLDSAPDYAVLYAATCACTVRSCALRTSTFTKHTPDRTGDGARIIRGANGEPTGVLNDATILGKETSAGTWWSMPRLLTVRMSASGAWACQSATMHSKVTLWAALANAHHRVGVSSSHDAPDRLGGT
jgi:predicted amidohydrolase YtcJ